MEIVLSPRRAGKTTQLIKMAAEDHLYLVCCTYGEMRRVWLLMLKMKEKGEIETLPPQPLTFDEFLEGKYYPRGIKGFLIDNADLLLQRLSYSRIFAITLTSDS